MDASGQQAANGYIIIVDLLSPLAVDLSANIREIQDIKLSSSAHEMLHGCIAQTL